MQFRILKKITLSLLAIGLVGLYGCGAGDEVLDEDGSMYTGSLIFSDVNDDATISIDVIQDADCNDDGTLDDPESFGPLYATLTITIDDRVNGLTLVDYEIEYIPLSTPLSGGGTVMPIALTDNFDHGNGTEYFPSDSEHEFFFTFLTTQTKAEYVTWWSGAPQNAEVDQGRYTFRLTCFFEDDFGVEREMVFERTVYLGNFDNC